MSDWVALRDKVGLKLRPIDQWPGEMTRAYNREKGPYSASLKDTIGILKTELNALNANTVVLQIAFRENHLRLDGLPRSGATAEHPGVILNFNSQQGPLQIPFDGFTDWRNNLRAIAMHLYHLRHAVLYGVGAQGQVYTGWKALPPPPTDTFAGMGNGHPVSEVREAAIFLRDNGMPDAAPEQMVTNIALREQAYRNAVMKLHPDKGGDPANFQKLKDALALIARNTR